jgi:hypothetical protein
MDAEIVMDRIALAPVQRNRFTAAINCATKGLYRIHTMLGIGEPHHITAFGR